MKELSPDDRPREKLLRHGAAALGDNELVALVLGNGSRSGNALSVANALLAAHGGLHGLTRTTCRDLMRIAGIGEARAAQIVAAMELGRRTLTHAPRARLQIRRPQDAVDYLMPRYAARPVEQFGIVLLDTRHRVLRSVVLAVGTLTARASSRVTSSAKPRLAARRPLWCFTTIHRGIRCRVQRTWS